MRIYAVAAITCIGMVSTPVSAGPISKFDDREFKEYTVEKSMFDIERCMIDVDGMFSPSVYRQPDRPNSVILLYNSFSDYAGGAKARIDMTMENGITKIRAWHSKQVKEKDLQLCISDG